MLLTTFLLALPFAPAVLASPSANVSVSLDNPAQLPGGPIIATLNVSPISDLQAYDLQLQFNPDVLTVQSASFGHTIFDLNDNGIISDDPVVQSIDLFQAGGFVHVFIFRSDGGSVSPVAPSPVLFVNFMVNGGANPAVPPAQSITELPTTIHIFSAQLSLADGSLVVASTTDATYSPPPSWFTSAPIALRTFFCKSSPTTLNTNSHHGFTIPLLCSVVNMSNSITVAAGAHWTWTSLSGITGSGGSGPVMLAPGQTAILTTSINVPGTIDIYTITAIVGYGFADGTATSSGAPFTYQLQINIPAK